MNHVTRGIASPNVGFYRVRLVRRGFPVPAQIDFSDGNWLIKIADATEYASYDNVSVQFVMMRWLVADNLNEHDYMLARLLAYGEEIEEAEYRRLMDMREWAMTCSPEHLCLHPENNIDLTKVPSLW